MLVKNEASFISAALDALPGQTLPADRFEIIVVDGGSTDETVEVVRRRAHEDSRIHLIGTADANWPASMNIGAPEAVGQYVAKVDGHWYVLQLSRPSNRGRSVLADFRYGRARAAVVVKHPDFLRPKHLAPAILAETLAASASALAFTRLRIAAARVWLAYVAFLLVGAGILAFRHRFARAELLVPSLASLHSGYGNGTFAGLWEWALRRRSR